jgi:4'-phosphopantetheinyl transferase
MGLESLCTAMIAVPPPFRAWSKHVENQCAPDAISAYWKTHEVLTFLADTGMYDASLDQGLDSAEKEQVMHFKSDYFKKRFAVSRSILRLILHNIPGMENNADIILNKEKNRRIRVNSRQDIFISLSYSGSCIAVSVGKRKIGSDIERVRMVNIMKIRSSPLFENLKSGNGKLRNQHFLHVWTLLEAYTKFHDMSLYPLVKDRFFLPDVHFVSYCIDKRYILSLASDSRPLKNALFWIDPETFSSAVKNATCISSPSCGDPYVRS